MWCIVTHNGTRAFWYLLPLALPFVLSDDWIEIIGLPSGNGKYFYVHKSEENEKIPTNISIEMGTNPYSSDNPIQFGQAIQRQLIIQTDGQANIEGGGIFTERGYPLLYFIIDFIETQPLEPKIIQYYIVGNKKHILIHLTDYHHDNVMDAETVARSIVDSFKW